MMKNEILGLVLVVIVDFWQEVTVLRFLINPETQMVYACLCITNTMGGMATCM